MITYSSTKAGFLNDILNNDYKEKILGSLVREVGMHVGKKEWNSWDSLRYMSDIIHDPEIPNDVGIAVEYKINGTSNRVDFIVTGKDENKISNAVIIELKQWSEGVCITDMDGVLRAKFYNNTEVPHPSYQAWSYKCLFDDYNQSVRDNNIKIQPCSYLHNYPNDNIILNEFYAEHLKNAPAFLKNDAVSLRSFIKKYVKYGDNRETLYLIENGKIKPSKHLADSLVSMMSDNQEFVLIDDQKIVYEMALKLASISQDHEKHVLIVEGGPGTGKSVLAINLLTELTNRRKNARYVTRNSAPRLVYQYKLTGVLKKSTIANLFCSSGSFYETTPNTFDVLIVDEAHRLNEKSGLYGNKGENQIKELINAARFTVFFVDEDQKVTLKDIGSKEAITSWANSLGAKVHNLTLQSQFRCNGSDGYIAWLDRTLQIRETANESLEGIKYDFQVLNTPTEVHSKIIEMNKANNKARIVAGYCWKWISKHNPELKDIVIGDYSATWNLNSQGQAWIIHPNSVSEVGCIHTCQGLELDYVGVIIGPDLVVRNGVIITDGTKRATSDLSVKGLKSQLKNNPEKAKKTADQIIKNTYRTLMTRGMKGCYIYCTDPETQAYFKEQIARKNGNESNYTNIPTGESFSTDNGYF